MLIIQHLMSLFRLEPRSNAGRVDSIPPQQGRNRLIEILEATYGRSE
jgi:hypothetical protein